MIKKLIGLLLVFSTFILSVTFVVVNAQDIEIPAVNKNGFILQEPLIPLDKILFGGPPKDGIPAIDNPKFVQAQNSNLSNTDRVLGVVIDGIAKAYPLAILNWHEVVNDSIAGQNLAVTFCPLCGSGVTFSANVAGEQLTFGVSGLLYNSDVLLYDRQTNSLWSQILGKAISGEHKGEKLTKITTHNTTFAAWVEQHPDSLVLTPENKDLRNYSVNPYLGYEQNERIYFPVEFRALQIHPKEKVIGIVTDDVSRAWPFVELSKADLPLNEEFSGETITIDFDVNSQSAKAFAADGSEIAATTMFWFAWSAFHPDTSVFKHETE